MLLKGSISTSVEFENLAVVIADDMEGAIDISDLLEMKLQDVRLYFGSYIEFLHLDDNVLDFLNYYSQTSKTLLGEVMVSACHQNQGESLKSVIKERKRA